MSSDNPKPEQIQANVAAALSRLRGDVMPPITSQAAPKLTGDNAGDAGTAAPSSPKPSSFFPQPPSAPSTGAQPHGASQQAPLTAGVSAGNASNAGLRAEPSLGLGNGASTMATPPSGTNYFGMSGKPAAVGGAAQPDLLSSVDMGPPPLAGYPKGDDKGARRRRNRRLVLAGAVAAIAVVGAIWLASGHKSEVPTLTAETTPEKVKPTDEGGLQVPNQNVQVLENMNGQNDQQKAGETVLPPPEQPIAPPAPTPDAQAAAPGQEGAGQPAASQPAAGQSAAGQPAGAQATPQSPTVAAPAVPTVPDAPAVPAVPAVPDTASAAASGAPAVPPAAAPGDTVAGAANTAPAAAQPAAEQVAAKPAAKPTTAQPAAGGKVKVQLAAVKSEAAAKTEWAKLQKAHPSQLGKLSLSVQKVDKGSGGVFYRIQAGPLADKASAKALCAELAQQKQACIVAR